MIAYMNYYNEALTQPSLGRDASASSDRRHPRRRAELESGNAKGRAWFNLENCGLGQNPVPLLHKARLRNRGRSVSRLGSYRFFEFLGGTEGDLLAGLDLDGGAGRRITAH